MKAGGIFPRHQGRAANTSEGCEATAIGKAATGRAIKSSAKSKIKRIFGPSADKVEKPLHLAPHPPKRRPPVGT